jgi:glycosyltransferase involved in cell wall biosynthesis
MIQHHKNDKEVIAHTILFVHHSSNFSGAENSLLHLTTRLDKETFRPIFICPGKGEFSKILSEKKIPIIPHEFGRNREIVKLLKSIRKICQVVRSHSIELIHSNGPQTNIPAGLAARWMGVPVIWHARNLLTSGMVDIDGFAGFLPQRILCNSETIKARFRSRRMERISKTIMNGVDIGEYDPTIPSSAILEEFGIPSTAKVLGMSSRLGKDKGHLTLLKAVARLKDRYPDLWVLIVGGNVFEEDAGVPGFLRTKAHEFGVADRTVFTGFRSDVSRLYAGMDIFILGTDAEPCGRVIFEAMAMEKPVVATNNGGTPEIVVNGETGLLFNYGDAEELASKIDYLLSRQELIQKMGNAGRKRIEENFTIDKSVQKTQREYLDLL